MSGKTVSGEEEVYREHWEMAVQVLDGDNKIK